MSFRITTNGMFHSYRGNLSRANKNLFHTMTQVQTERKFNSYAEDPAAANRAFQMRRSYWNTGNQMDNSKYLLAKFQTGWDALDSIVDGDVDNPGLDGILSSLRAITDTAGSGRSILGQTLKSTAEAIVGAMNVRYGDTYVFAGANGLDVPFTWRTGTDEYGNEIRILQYRGVDVDTPTPAAAFEQLKAASTLDDTSSMEAPLTKEEFEKRQESDKPMLFNDFDEYKDFYAQENKVDSAALDEYYANRANYAKLEEMNNESTLVDIGLGFRLNDDGKTINPATAYNSALSGIQVLGFGVDDDGDAKNIVSLMRELGEIFNRCDPDSGEYKYEGDKERAEALIGKLHSAVGRVQEQHAILDGKSDYLQKNLTQLGDNKFNLNEEILNVEEMDMAEAIQNMMWAQYTYNAALRIGTQILSQSLFDYLG